MIMASSSGTPVAAIARLVAADEDTVRDVIHAFNERGLAALDPHWAGGRPRQISDADIAFIARDGHDSPDRAGCPVHALERAETRRPPRLLRPPAAGPGRAERLRVILREHHVSFQRTRTWKESTDPDKDVKLDRIEYVTSHFLMRCFAFDQFGPLSIRPCHGSTWAPESKPVRLPATNHRTHGIRYFHGCYSLGDDQLWGVNRRRKGGDHSLAAIKSIRAARPDGAPIYVVMNNLSANKTRRPDLGGTQQCRAVPNPDLRVLGEPARGPVRAATHVHHGRMRSPEPSGAGAPDTGVSALAQRPPAAPRRPRRPAPEWARIRCERQQRWGRPRAA